MKKILYILLTFIMIFCNLKFVYADDILEEEFSKNDLENIISTSATTDEELILNSRIAIAYDRESGKTIWGKNENKRTAMASTTKIMTAIIVVEKSNLDDVVTISSKAAGTGGSRLGLKKNDKISMRDLLYGLMMKSGNDAAVAIAEQIAGSVDAFVVLMNEKVKELNLKDTHFVTPHGLDDPAHYTTAYELAQIADYALKNEIIAKVVSTKFYTININGYPKDLSNTNELLGNLEGVNGVKTGFTNNAGRCLVTSVDRSGFNIITVVIQADTKKDRTRDSIKIIEHIYENYMQVNIKEIADEKFEEWCNINKGRISINKAKNLNINLQFNNLENNVVVVKKQDLDNIKIEINLIFELEAPVKSNTIVGKLKVMVKDVVIDVEDVYIENYVAKKDVYDYFFECIRAYAWWRSLKKRRVQFFNINKSPPSSKY
ncbi:MAG: D-alanyl-D-alanine carboxypeptidase [Clostridia bacterium]|nr:D-alanyl-D-alanine carboxypeptidase [Clostridia bacterium]